VLFKLDNMDKYGRIRHVTDDIVWRMRCAYWIMLQTHTQYKHNLLLVNDNSGYANATQYYVHCHSS